eukprot:m.362102 g.362102  ORF g.362102 m.362102 type:complete len:344 (+) comp20130_c0_seq1:149-1180(+)
MAEQLRQIVAEAIADEAQVEALMQAFAQLGTTTAADIRDLAEQDIVDEGASVESVQALFRALRVQEEEQQEAAALEVEEGQGAPRYVLVAVDTSGSMNGIRIQRTCQGVIRLVENLKPEDYCVVIPFSTRVNAPILAQKRSDMEMSVVTQQVNNLIASGSTCLYDMLFEGVQNCRQAPATFEYKQFVVFTDGDDTASTRSLAQAVEEITHPDVRGFSFVAMAVNPSHGLQSVFAQMTAMRHAKLLQITTASSDATAVSASFDRLDARLHEMTARQAFDPDAGAIMRDDDSRASRSCSLVRSVGRAAPVDFQPEMVANANDMIFDPDEDFPTSVIDDLEDYDFR